jgi:hypothetical protein
VGNAGTAAGNKLLVLLPPLVLAGWLRYLAGGAAADLVFRLLSVICAAVCACAICVCAAAADEGVRVEDLDDGMDVDSAGAGGGLYCFFCFYCFTPCLPATAVLVLA